MSHKSSLGSLGLYGNLAADPAMAFFLSEGGVDVCTNVDRAIEMQLTTHTIARGLGVALVIAAAGAVKTAGVPGDDLPKLIDNMLLEFLATVKEYRRDALSKTHSDFGEIDVEEAENG